MSNTVYLILVSFLFAVQALKCRLEQDTRTQEEFDEIVHNCLRVESDQLNGQFNSRDDNRNAGYDNNKQGRYKPSNGRQEQEGNDNGYEKNNQGRFTSQGKREHEGNGNRNGGYDKSNQGRFKPSYGILGEEGKKNRYEENDKNNQGRVKPSDRKREQEAYNRNQSKVSNRHDQQTKYSSSKGEHEDYNEKDEDEYDYNEYDNENHEHETNQNKGAHQNNQHFHDSNQNADSNKYNFQNTGSPLESVEPCVIHCIFKQKQLLNQENYIEKNNVIRALTKKINDAELRQFVRDSVIECFGMINSEKSKGKCEDSKTLALCLEEIGKNNCDDWDNSKNKKRENLFSKINDNRRPKNLEDRENNRQNISSYNRNSKSGEYYPRVGTREQEKSNYHQRDNTDNNEQKIKFSDYIQRG